MRDYKAVWREIKQPTVEQTLQRLVLIATKAKSNQKFEVLCSLVYRAFTPVTNTKKLQNGELPFGAVQLAAINVRHNMQRKYKDESLTLLENCLENEEEQQQYKNLLEMLVKHRLEDKTYSYFLVSTKQSPEQMLVQFGHAAYELGAKTHYTKELNYVVYGVDNGEQMRIVQLLKENCIPHIVFKDRQICTVATYAMRASVAKRKHLFDTCSLLTLN